MFNKFIKLLQTLSKKEIVAIIAAFSLVLIALFLYAGHIVFTNTIQVPARGGIWREGIVGQPVFIHPVISNNKADHDISKFVFDDLKELSASIEPDNEGKEWVVRLKEGLKWSDGERITSDDIIFTFDTIINPESRSPISSSFDGANIRRISELEVRFVLPSPFVFFGESLKNLVLMPKHIFASIPPANFALSSYAREPVGSGPYKFSSLTRERNGFISEYTLIRNEYYHGKKPYVNSIVFRFYGNERQLITAFNNGHIDGFPLSDPSLLEQVSVIKTARPISASRYYAVFINSGIISQFRDINIRRAMSFSVPREEITANIFKGFAYPAFGPFKISSLPAEKPTLVETVLNGLEFTLTVPDAYPILKIAEELKKTWGAKGAIVHISALRAADIEEVINNRDYEALLFGNILTTEEDLYSFWHSSKRFYPGLNIALFNNRRADELILDIRAEFDSEKRNNLIKELSSVITEDVGAIFLAFPDYLYITTPRLRGFFADKAVISADRFNNIEYWHINTHRKFR